PAAGEQVAALALDEGEQPAAEGAAGRVVVEAPDAATDGAQHVLREVSGVRVLQAVAAPVLVHQRRVQPHKLSPGSRVLWVAHANQQADPRRGGMAHWLPSCYSGTSGRIYRAAGFLIRPRQELQEMIGGGWEGGEGKAARREWYGPSGRPNVRPIRGVEQASKDVRHPQGSERGSCASGHRFHPRAGSAGRGAGAGVGSPPSLGVPNRD